MMNRRSERRRRRSKRKKKEEKKKKKDEKKHCFALNYLSIFMSLRPNSLKNVLGMTGKKY